MPPSAKLDSILMPDLTIPFELSTASSCTNRRRSIVQNEKRGGDGPGEGGTPLSLDHIPFVGEDALVQESGQHAFGGFSHHDESRFQPNETFSTKQKTNPNIRFAGSEKSSTGQ